MCKNIRAIKKIPIPKKVKDARAYIGLTDHYKKFMNNFARIASPLIKLTKNNVDYDWGTEREIAFEFLKKNYNFNSSLRPL